MACAGGWERTISNTRAVSNSKKINHVVTLLASYNGLHFLSAQAQSILNQTLCDIHITLSVDRSNDGTEVLAKSLEAGNSRITCLPLGERYGSAAPNFFRLMRDTSFEVADYVALADQDDIWYPEKIARACAALQTTGADGYSSNVMAFWPSGEEKLINKAQPQRDWDFLFEGPGPGCTFVMTQKLALHLQSFIRENEQALRGIGFHDWLIYAFARAHGYRWYIDPVPSMHYRQHDNNQFGANAGMASFVKRARGVLEGWWLRQSILTAQLVGLGEHPFVKRWSSGQRLGLAWLALQARHCRRKRVHQWLFALSCLVLALRLPGRGGKT